VHVVDFRVRPNTTEYMSLYQDPTEWTKLGFCRPKEAPLGAFLQALDGVGVSLAVFPGCDTHHGTLASDYIAACVAASSGRLVGFAGVDPLRGVEALCAIETAVTKLGFKGVSLDPYCIARTPDDDLFVPIYRACIDFAIPVVLTMGPFTGEWGHPRFVASIAERFPELKIVCSHGVWPQVTEFISLAYVHDNVFLETSAYIGMPGARLVLDAARTILAEKILYASAYPFRPLDDYKTIVEYGLPPSVEERLLRVNALSLLKLGG
jgi:predicted TIM-barrel fold metal-dependent hydrolase